MTGFTLKLTRQLKFLSFLSQAAASGIKNVEISQNLGNGLKIKQKATAYVKNNNPETVNYFERTHFKFFYSIQTIQTYKQISNLLVYGRYKRLQQNKITECTKN